MSGEGVLPALSDDMAARVLEADLHLAACMHGYSMAPAYSGAIETRGGDCFLVVGDAVHELAPEDAAAIMADPRALFCTTKPAPGKDLCPAHAAEWEARKGAR